MYLELSMAVIQGENSFGQCYCSAAKYCGKSTSEYKLCHYKENVLNALDSYLNRVESYDPEIGVREREKLMDILERLTVNKEDEDVSEYIFRVEKLLNDINNYIDFGNINV